jgi:hypothetical protein
MAGKKKQILIQELEMVSLRYQSIPPIIGHNTNQVFPFNNIDI